MMRKQVGAALALTLLLSGCTSLSQPQQVIRSATTAAAAPDPAPASLADVGSPDDLSLPDLLTQLHAYLGSSTEPASVRLGALFERWWGGMKPDRIPKLAEADLNGDGVPELITAVGGLKEAPHWVVLVVSGKPGAYRLDTLLPEVQPVKEGFLYASAPVGFVDLSGDGKPEFIWQMTTVVGATGGPAYIVTGGWEPGRVRQIGNAVYMPNPTGVALENGTLTVRGGLAGGAGARAVQRPRTDRYRWEKKGWRLSDRRFVTVEQGYHYLIDGIVAEMFGHPDEAESAYRKAFAPDLPALKEPRQLRQPEQYPEFEGAIRVLARLRLAALKPGAPGALQEYGGPFVDLLTAVAGSGERPDLCRQAEAWALEHPEFIAALNLPQGVGNPEWGPDNLCGPVAFEGLE